MKTSFEYLVRLHPGLVNLAEKLGLTPGEELTNKALRQYLFHIKSTREYKNRHLTDPNKERREAWLKKKRDAMRRSNTKRRAFERGETDEHRTD